MRFEPIQILQIKSIRGPNMWTYRPILEAWVDIGALEDYPSNTIPGFVDRLMAWIPSLETHRCSYGTHGGFLQRLREGTWPAHIVEHVTLELQSLAGLSGGFGKARDGDRRGVYKVIVRAWHEDLTRKALNYAIELVMAAINDDPFDLQAAVEDLTEIAEDRLLGPSTASIVDAAYERGIPTIRLSDNNLVQLGYGAKQRRIWTAETDQTSAIAETISRDKDLTKRLLSAAGLPVPEGESVESPDAAWAAAQEIGLPVVVKPSDANHGRGVFINLTQEDDIRQAFAVANEEGSSVLVERFVPGQEHRLLVVGGRMVAAARGDNAVVHGDGQHTVKELIALQINSDPRRGYLEEHPLNPIRIDSAVTLELKRQGLTPESIPADGLEVLIQRAGNVSIDVTDQVHPSVAADVVLAAKVVGLDVAGIDLVAQDISQPLLPQRAAIVEVNAGPGLLMHLKPAAGEPRPVGLHILNHLFPQGQDFHLPIVGVSGAGNRSLTAQLTSSLLQLSKKTVGLACSAGAFLNQQQLEAGNAANRLSGHRLLLNRQVQQAVIESSLETVLNEGLAYERCTVGIVLGLDPQGVLPDCAINDAEQIFSVLRTQIDVVLPQGYGVINADDPLLTPMAKLCDGEVIYCSNQDRSAEAAPDHPLAEHLRQGGRAVIAENGSLVLAKGLQAHQTLLSLSQIPLLADPRHGTQPQQAEQTLQAVMAAVAAAWALNIPRDLIATGLQTWN